MFYFICCKSSLAICSKQIKQKNIIEIRLVGLINCLGGDFTPQRGVLLTKTIERRNMIPGNYRPRPGLRYVSTKCWNVQMGGISTSCRNSLGLDKQSKR